ncbi:universal stress protein [Kitasatospora mediocidica]|uniref:universal stress protein n=1 Tax=Kitasatospora mediocidica TaxID=58352 RepID=UPI000559CCDC|nr:universal stress protein [Kitasatospora mediocidica]
MTTAPVVAAIGGSEDSARVVDWAADEAARQGRPLQVAHAWRWSRYETDETGSADYVRARQVVQDMLSEAANRATARRPGLRVSTWILADDKLPGLLRIGRRAALVVVGSRKHRAADVLMPGTVATGLVRHAEFPVVVVRGEQPLPDSPHRVVLAVAPDHDPGPAARFALAQAASRQAELEVVHAWHPDVDLSGMAVVMDTGPALERAQALLTAVATPLEGNGTTKIRRSALVGTPAGHLVEATTGADLLVIGARRGRRHLGPLTRELLRHAPCPVAVIPHD